MCLKIERYTKEFKNTIIELYKSGKSLVALHGEYGIPKSTISTWLSHIFKLRRWSDIKRIKEENKILKKAMPILAKK